MNSQIEKYLRDIGNLEEKWLIHTLLSSYVRIQIEKLSKKDR
jgi:hypothetical protein